MPFDYQDHRDGFARFLKQAALTEASRRTVKIAISRALRHLGEHGIHNAHELRLYRLSLSSGMRSHHGFAWRHFGEYLSAQNVQLPTYARLPITRITHPLWADVAVVSSNIGWGQVEELRWGHRIPYFGDEADILRPAQRIFQFIRNRAPELGDTFVPLWSHPTKPMPWWMAATILDTGANNDSRDHENAVHLLLETAVHKDIPALRLKQLWDCIEQYQAGRHSHSRLLALRTIRFQPGAWSDTDQDVVIAVLHDDPQARQLYPWYFRDRTLDLQ